MAPARLWFLAILEAARSSTTTTDLVLASVVVNLCSLSTRMFVIRYHIFWCLRRALRWFLPPFAFLARAFWACLSRHFNRSSLGLLSRVVPSLTVAGWMMPQSTPATGPSFSLGLTLFFLTPMETNHLPALLETVAHRTWLRAGRYPRSFSLTQPNVGRRIILSLTRTAPVRVNDCFAPCLLLLNDGQRKRSLRIRKLWKALPRSLSASCGAHFETSYIQGYSFAFLALDRKST